MSARMQRLGRFAGETLRWRGRASRRDFYFTILIFYLVGFATLPLQWLAEANEGRPLYWLFGAPFYAIGVGMLMLLVGGGVRRLHDRNKSGWWLLAFFGPLALMAFALSRIPAENQQLITTAFLICFAFVAPPMAWGMVEILAFPGVKGVNKYGADPLDPAAREEPTVPQAQEEVG